MGYTGHALQTDHIGTDDEAHTKGGAQVGQRRQLIFFKILAEVMVIGQRQDGGIIRQESRDQTERSGTGQVIQGTQQGREQMVENTDNAKLCQQCRKRTGQNTDGHQIEAGVDQQVEGCVHHGVEHIDHAHGDGKKREEGNKADRENQWLTPWVGLFVHR